MYFLILNLVHARECNFSPSFSLSSTAENVFSHFQPFCSGRGWYQPCYGSRVRAQPEKEEEGAEDALLPQEEEEGQEGEGRKEEGEDAGLIPPLLKRTLADFHNLTQTLSWKIQEEKFKLFWEWGSLKDTARAEWKSSLPHNCVSAPLPIYAPACVCVCMHKYVLLSLHTHTHTPMLLPSHLYIRRSEPCADILLEKLCFLCLTINKLYCCCEWLGVRGQNILFLFSIYEINPSWESILTCVEAGRVALSPDFSPWVQNMWLVTLISAGSPYSFRETLPSSSSASRAFGGLLGHRQPSLCVSIESSFSPSQKPPKKPLKTLHLPKTHPILPFLIFSVSIMYFPTAHFLLQ